MWWPGVFLQFVDVVTWYISTVCGCGDLIYLSTLPAGSNDGGNQSQATTRYIANWIQGFKYNLALGGQGLVSPGFLGQMSISSLILPPQSCLPSILLTTLNAHTYLTQNCDLQDFWLIYPSFAYLLSYKCHLRNKSSISDEVGDEVRKIFIYILDLNQVDV